MDQIGSYVRTVNGDWSNLARAAGIVIRPSNRHPGVWVVFAVHAGRHTPLCEADSRTDADQACRELLELIDGWRI